MMTKWKLLEGDGRFFGRCEKMGEKSSCFLKGMVATFLRKGVRV
jgi:hypothetical protein